MFRIDDSWHKFNLDRAFTACLGPFKTPFFPAVPRLKAAADHFTTEVRQGVPRQSQGFSIHDPEVSQFGLVFVQQVGNEPAVQVGKRNAMTYAATGVDYALIAEETDLGG